ncbi:putative membrane protein [Desulfitispora alkaliphila]|uniref:DUF7507 domain-containing protein n=1 Tax=Desulfitispora alkaliphila TaxID=622674 RepID=UPI003D199E86
MCNNQPSIDVDKFVSPDGSATFLDADTPSGPNIPQGTDPVFKYVVTNTGNVPLEKIILDDDVLGTITIPTTTLDSGESFTVVVTGTWVEDQQVNTATVIGDYEDIIVTDKNLAHYVGVVADEPAINIDKLVSSDGGTIFLDADTPPGATIHQGTDPIFRYVVTNTGNVPLENITLTDDILGPITIPTTTLTPGESFTVDLTDNHPANKSQGSYHPVFRYVVTNTGNVPLENITLTDDVLGLITIPTTTLAPGESFIVDETGTWAEGQQVNKASVTGEYEDITVTDDDPAHYVGVVVDEPAINVEKFASVDGGKTFIASPVPPGPKLPSGMTAYFKYIVTNIGNVPVADITITDNVLGVIGTIPILLPGESEEFIAPPLP